MFAGAAGWQAAASGGTKKCKIMLSGFGSNCHGKRVWSRLAGRTRRRE